MKINYTIIETQQFDNCNTTIRELISLMENGYQILQVTPTADAVHYILAKEEE